MKKRLFIPISFLVFAVNAIAQEELHVQPADNYKPGAGKLIVRSITEISTPLLLPPDGAVSVQLGEQLLYSGYVRKQKLHGTWSSYYTNRQPMDSGYLQQGIPDGEWKHWDSAGHLVAVRHYSAVKLQQVKEEIRLPHPKRSFYVLSSMFRSDRSKALFAMSAAYSFSLPAIQRPALSLQQAVEHNYTPGNHYIPLFTECLHHGLYMNFFSGGISKDSGYYKNGLREGAWLHRNNPNGHTRTGAYKNGHRYREWKEYDTTGKLVSLTFYNKEGVVEWTKDFRR